MKPNNNIMVFQGLLDGATDRVRNRLKPNKPLLWLITSPVSRWTPSASLISTPLSWSLLEATQELFLPQATFPKARLIVAQGTDDESFSWIVSWAERQLESFPRERSTTTTAVTASLCDPTVEITHKRARVHNRDGGRAIATLGSVVYENGRVGFYATRGWGSNFTWFPVEIDQRNWPHCAAAPCRMPAELIRGCGF